MSYAIIGGSGVYQLLPSFELIHVSTPYGIVHLQKVQQTEPEQTLFFLPRHGKGHRVPPHGIDYRANIYALKSLGVTHVFASCAVGSMVRRLAPGDLVLLTDFIDMTKSRIQTYFTGDNPEFTGAAHLEMSDPYCIELRRRLLSVGRENKTPINSSGIYVCTEGPRFETASEIRMYQRMGGEVVGMTSVPEVILAKELGMCYAAIGIVTNWCTGFVDESVSHDELMQLLKQSKEIVTQLLVKSFRHPFDQLQCSCGEALFRINE